MKQIKILVMLGVTFALTACASYVKRDEFDSTVADLRAADTRLEAADTDLRSQLELMETRFARLTDEMQGTFSNMQAQITQLRGRIRVDMTAHFGYDQSELTAEDEAALAEVSEVLRDYQQSVVVTVEGFTDPAGSPEYNKWLGMQRAKAVRDYLLQAGLDADQVRAVSYGEDANRQLAPGAWGESGDLNRRVSLVIDYVPG